MLHELLDILVPRRCVVCRAGGRQLCPRCLEALPRIVPPLCETCGAGTAWPVRRCRECHGRRLSFRSARAAVAYDARVRTLVSAWKERGLRLLAADAAAIVAEVVPKPDVAALAAVPADGDRGLRRGHDPPLRLAAELARIWDLPLEPLLERTRPARPQRGLARHERRANVRGAFRARSRAPPRVAIVDDVYTTGATAAAAATALRAAGTGHVEVVTFARAVR